jgi:hypothetical protein
VAEAEFSRENLRHVYRGKEWNDDEFGRRARGALRRVVACPALTSRRLAMTMEFRLHRGILIRPMTALPPKAEVHP